MESKRKSVPVATANNNKKTKKESTNSSESPAPCALKPYALLARSWEQDEINYYMVPVDKLSDEIRALLKNAYSSDWMADNLEKSHELDEYLDSCTDFSRQYPDIILAGECITELYEIVGDY